MTDAYLEQVRQHLADARAELAAAQRRYDDEHATAVARAHETDRVRGRLAKAEVERETYRAAWHSAKDRARKQHVRAEAAEAELAALHAGEEPYEDERLTPTPAQWIWGWNRATPELRLAQAQQVLSLHDRVDRCTWGFHEERVADQRHAIRRAGAAERRAEQAEARIAAVRAECTQFPGAHSPRQFGKTVGATLAARVLAALDGPAEQPAEPGLSPDPRPVSGAWLDSIAAIKAYEQPLAPTLAAMVELDPEDAEWRGTVLAGREIEQAAEQPADDRTDRIRALAARIADGSPWETDPARDAAWREMVQLGQELQGPAEGAS